MSNPKISLVDLEQVIRILEGYECDNEDYFDVVRKQIGSLRPIETLDQVIESLPKVAGGRNETCLAVFIRSEDCFFSIINDKLQSVKGTTFRGKSVMEAALKMRAGLDKGKK